MNLIESQEFLFILELECFSELMSQILFKSRQIFDKTFQLFHDRAKNVTFPANQKQLYFFKKISQLFKKFYSHTNRNNLFSIRARAAKPLFAQLKHSLNMNSVSEFDEVQGMGKGPSQKIEIPGFRAGSKIGPLVLGSRVNLVLSKLNLFFRKKSQNIKKILFDSYVWLVYQKNSGTGPDPDYILKKFPGQKSPG